MADGSITFSTAFDNKELERELNRLTKKIESLQEKINQKKSARSPLVEEAKQLGREYDEARKKLEYMQSGDSFFTKGHIAEQAETVKQLEAQWDKVGQQADKYRAEIYDCTQELNRHKEKAGAVGKQLATAESNASLMGDAVRRAGKSMDKFKSRLREVIRSALIFTVITQSLAKFRDWMGKVVQSNAEASAAMARLKGALLTLAQPLVEVIIPAFTMLVNVLTRIATAIASVMSMMFGKTIDQSTAAAESLGKETEALGATGKAAKKAGKQLAAFDETNKLSSDSADGGGGGISTAPSFDFDTANSEGDLNMILNVVRLIGAALLAWRFSDGFKDGLVKFAGFFLAIDGAIRLAKGTWDAWQEGVDWENLTTMLVGATELIIGLGLALGPVGAGIGAIVSGLMMLATAFHDADENGWNMQNTMLGVAGILSTGLGISLLTGSFIPALIAGIAAVLLAITTTFGDGKKLIADAKLILQGFLDFFTGIFTGDIGLALKGIGEIFDGLRGIVDNVLNGIKNMIFSFLDWLDEKTGGKFHGIIQFVKDLVGGTIDWMRESFEGFANAFQQILEGVVTFLSGVFTGDWDKAWEGLKDIGKGALNLLTSMIESFVNFFINGLNTLITALNKIEFTAPDWVPVIGGNTYGVNIPLIPKLEIPKLATGAVIPPNREFMAVLGDQRSGTNIEAPLATIEEAVARVIGRQGGGGQEITIRFDGNMGQLVRAMRPYLDAEDRRRGARLVRGGVY